MKLLVDTSVWIDHFKNPNRDLVVALNQDIVLTHPLIIGEVICGTPPQRGKVIRNLQDMGQSYVPLLDEVSEFVEKHKLYGLGCGFIDINLLLSSLITPQAKLWTKDKRLFKLAKRFNIGYEAPAS